MRMTPLLPKNPQCIFWLRAWYPLTCCKRMEEAQIKTPKALCHSFLGRRTLSNRFSDLYFLWRPERQCMSKRYSYGIDTACEIICYRCFRLGPTPPDCANSSALRECSAKTLWRHGP